MKALRNVLILLLIPVLGWSQTAEPLDPQLLHQKWVLVGHDEDGLLYQSSQEFNEDMPGMAFLEDGTLVMRQNAGWCGTPPITYDNFSGTWMLVSESDILLEHEFWGGTIKSTITIVALDEKTLRVTQRTDEVIHNR